MILEGIPRVGHGDKIFVGDSELIEAVLGKGGWSFRRKGDFLGGQEERFLSILAAMEGGERKKAVKIWAAAETKFSVIEDLIQAIRQAGITEVFLVVQEEGLSFESGLLKIDILSSRIDSELHCGFYVGIDRVGRITFLNESGVLEILSEEKFADLTERFQTVREVAGFPKVYWRFSVDREASYQHVAKILGLASRGESELRLQDPVESRFKERRSRTIRKPKAPSSDPWLD